MKKLIVIAAVVLIAISAAFILTIDRGGGAGFYEEGSSFVMSEKDMAPATPEIHEGEDFSKNFARSMKNEMFGDLMGWGKKLDLFCGSLGENVPPGECAAITIALADARLMLAVIESDSMIEAAIGMEISEGMGMGNREKNLENLVAFLSKEDKLTEEEKEDIAQIQVAIQLTEQVGSVFAMIISGSEEPQENIAGEMDLHRHVLLAIVVKNHFSDDMILLGSELALEGKIIAMKNELIVNSLMGGMYKCPDWAPNKSEEPPVHIEREI